MSEYAQPAEGRFEDDDEQPRLWGGLIAFAALMLTLLGGFHVIGGFIALLEQDAYYTAGAEEMIRPITSTAFGITHIVVGVVMMFAGYGVFWGKTWGRAVAVAVASLSAITNVVSLSAEAPRFALMLVLDVLVIFAVVVHGDRRRFY